VAPYPIVLSNTSVTRKEVDMHPTYVFRILVILLLALSTARAQGLRLQVEMENPIRLHSFTKTQSLFVSEGERSFLYDLNTGKKLYELKQENYEPKGLLSVIGDKFLVSSEKEINCYDIASGRRLWARNYHDIDQEYFASLVQAENPLVLLYGGVLLVIDPSTGNEIWYQTFKFNAGVSVNFKILNKQKKFFALLEDDKIAVYDLATGKQLGEVGEFEISSTMVEKKYSYYSLTADERYGIFLLDEHVAVMDFAQNKEVGRVEISYDSDVSPIVPTEAGCVVLGKKKIVFVNAKTGALSEVPASVGDFRTYQIMTVGGREVLVAGLKDAMFALDLAGGKVLWQTKDDDPNFEGYAHRYIKAEGNSVIFTYNNTGMSIGTDLFLMSVDAFTGKLNYKIPVANSGQAIMGLQRTMANFVANNEGTTSDFGYDNIGFDYSFLEYNGNLVLAIASPHEMHLPEKRTGGGEGVCVIDPKTGRVLFADYLALSYEVAEQRTGANINVQEPILERDKLVLVGNEFCAVWDLSSMKRMWLSEKLFENASKDIAVIDNVLYIKFGYRRMDVKLTKEPAAFFANYGLKVEEAWDEKPYAIAAYDLLSGKRLWIVETKEDPGFATYLRPMMGSYHAPTKRLYFSGETGVFALQMRRDGGKYDWTYDLAANGLGKIPLEESYAMKEFPIGEWQSSYSFSGGALYRTDEAELGGAGYDDFQKEARDAYDYLTFSSAGTVWGVTATKCLRFAPVKENFLVIADKGIALVNSGDGRTVWKSAWEYDQEGLQLLPVVLGDKLVYCLDRKLTSISMANGSKRLQVEESKRPHFIFSPDGKHIVTIDDDGEVIKGYEL
jgi:outer membrane protein assembly factor BamB